VTQTIIKNTVMSNLHLTVLTKFAPSLLAMCTLPLATGAGALYVAR